MGKGLPRGSGGPVGAPTAPFRECPPHPNTETSPRTGPGTKMCGAGPRGSWLEADSPSSRPAPGTPIADSAAVAKASAAHRRLAGGEAPVWGGRGSRFYLSGAFGAVTPRGSRGHHVPP